MGEVSRLLGSDEDELGNAAATAPTGGAGLRVGILGGGRGGSLRRGTSVLTGSALPRGTGTLNPAPFPSLNLSGPINVSPFSL